MRARVIVLVVAASCWLAACTMWKEKQPPTWNSATGPEAFERLLWDEIKAKNWKQVEKHLAASFTATTPAGAYDRSAWMAQWQGAPVETVSLGDFVSQPNGADMVLAYVANIEAGGQARALRVMSVWQETKAGWVMIAHSEAPTAQ